MWEANRSKATVRNAGNNNALQMQRELKNSFYKTPSTRGSFYLELFLLRHRAIKLRHAGTELSVQFINALNARIHALKRLVEGGAAVS